MGKTLFFLAGEVSGDARGAELIEELLAADPSLHCTGIGGPKMRALPFTCLMPMEKLQVMGFLDVLAALPRLIILFHKIKRMILRADPDMVVFIDYPGLNLRLAQSLKKKKIRAKLVQYVCPTVWAWGKKRIPKMEQTLDLLLTLFPFEPAYFPNLNAHYIGHPLLKKIPSRMPDQSVVIFPGSRIKEIHRNLPLQIKALEELGIPFTISCASPKLREHIAQYAADHPVDEDQDKLMQTASFAVATSGTITLELALASIPTVVTFAIRPLDVFLAQKVFKINLPHYCIVNIIGGKTIFPELFGPNLTLANLKDAIATLNQAQCISGCNEVQTQLQEKGEKSSDKILHLI